MSDKYSEIQRQNNEYLRGSLAQPMLTDSKIDNSLKSSGSNVFQLGNHRTAQGKKM